jgi:hypothetical protein
MALIEFELKPLAEVASWGAPADPNLSWFGLTDGVYWIQAGDAALFEYSELEQRRGTQRYCDYQVVRLHEDLMAIAPHVLEPVPADLARLIAGDLRREWDASLSRWLDSHFESDDDDEDWRVLDTATSWIWRRRLASQHLSPPARIWMWSDRSEVRIKWDNQEAVENGACVWSAVQGAFVLAREDFPLEVRKFHERLMGEMATRIRAVAGGALAPGIRVDVAGLFREQQQRRQLDLVPSTTTNWDAVRRAVAEIERA